MSPSPESIEVLLKSGLDSASAIARIDRESFIEKYGPRLGGAEVALDIHERACLSNQYFGLYRGIVTGNNDPSDGMRIRVQVPEVLGEEETWASPCVPPGVRSVPDVGNLVWISVCLVESIQYQTSAHGHLAGYGSFCLQAC